MFARISALLALTSVFLLASAGGPYGGGHGGNQVQQCNGGSVTCCNQVQDAKALDETFAGLLQEAGVDVSDIQGQVGANCSPVNVMAGGTGGSWSVIFLFSLFFLSKLTYVLHSSAQQLCCEKVHNSAHLTSILPDHR